MNARQFRSLHLHNHKFIKKVAEQLGEGWWTTCISSDFIAGGMTSAEHEYHFKHEAEEFAIRSNSLDKIDDEALDELLYLHFISKKVPEPSYKLLIQRMKKGAVKI